MKSPLITALVALSITSVQAKEIGEVHETPPTPQPVFLQPVRSLCFAPAKDGTVRCILAVQEKGMDGGNYNCVKQATCPSYFPDVAGQGEVCYDYLVCTPISTKK